MRSDTIGVIGAVLILLGYFVFVGWSVIEEEKTKQAKYQAQIASHTTENVLCPCNCEVQVGQED